MKKGWRDDEAKVKARLVENGTPADLAALYAAQYVSWREANRNIRENGLVVVSPRTGQPMDNPFAKHRADAEKALQRFGRKVRSAGLWDE